MWKLFLTFEHSEFFQHMNNRESLTVWREILQVALEELTQLLQEEGVVSAYELHSSGLVQALLSLLSTSCWDEGLHSNKSTKLQKQRVRVFKSCFKVMNCILWY
jgi:E3 ubiquitin-protein ligase HECTD1